MERTRFSLRTVLWILTLAAFLIGWSIDRYQMEEKRRRAEIALFHAESTMATLQARLDALEYAQATIEKNRRAAAGITD